MARKTRKTSLAYLQGMTVAELCVQYWQNHFNVQSQSDKQKAFSKRLEREAFAELAIRLGAHAVEGALANHLEGKTLEYRHPDLSPSDPKPQRIRAPRVMYIEQKSDGKRGLHDQGPAEIGAVSF